MGAVQADGVVLMDGAAEALKRSVHSIAEALLDIAQVDNVDSINVHASVQRSGSGYISGFAVNGDTLLFDFREIVGADE